MSGLCPVMAIAINRREPPSTSDSAELDVQFLLFNNEIYGLTKGNILQRQGRDPVALYAARVRGTPVSPVAALGAGARFIARGIDSVQKELPDVFARAHALGALHS